MAFLVVLAVLIFKDSAFQPVEITPEAGPEVVSVTMVSQETGLQVVWFLDKNFEWKGDKE